MEEARKKKWGSVALIIGAIAFIIILKSATIIQYTIKGRFMSR